MLESLIIPILTGVAVLTAIGVFVAYNIVARWWQTRSGTAYWILFASLILLAGHFLREDFTGQAPIRETVVLILLIGALVWNFVVIVWKQWHYRHDGKHPHHHDQ